MDEEYHIIKPSGFFHYNGTINLKLLIEELREGGKLDSTPLKYIKIDENGYLKIKKDKELINKVYSHLIEWYYENVVYRTKNNMYLIDITKRPLRIIQVPKRDILPISKEKVKNLKPLVYAMSKEDILKSLEIDEEKFYAEIENAIKEKLSKEELDFIEKNDINIINFDTYIKNKYYRENELFKTIGEKLNEILINKKKNKKEGIIYKTNKKNSFNLKEITDFYVYKGFHPEELGKNTTFELKEGKKCYICSLNLTKKVRKSIEDEKQKNIVLDSEINMMDFGTSTPVNRDKLKSYSFPICGLCEIIYKISFFTSFYHSNYVINFYTVPFQNNIELIKKIAKLTNKNIIDFPKAYEGNKNNKSVSNLKDDELIFGTDTPSLFLLSLLNYISKKLEEIKKHAEEIKREELEIDKIEEFYRNINEQLSRTRVVLLEKADIPSTFEVYYELDKKIKLLLKVEENKEGNNPILNLVKQVKLPDRKYAKEEINSIYENLSKNILNGNIRFLHYILPSLFLCVLEETKVEIGIKDIKILLNAIKEVYGMENEDLIRKAQEVGKSIGYVAGETENKDILYQLRETKTKNSLIKLIKEVLYVGLKNLEGDREDKIIGNIKKNEETIYNIIENIKDDEIDVFMDVLSVYALLKYFSVLYAKKNRGGGKDE